MYHCTNNEVTIALLRLIGSPFLQMHQKYASYSGLLYSTAERNKIPLMYLSTIALDKRQKIPEYVYHYTRLQRLLEIVAEISDLFERKDLNYVIFKTLRPYTEDVADIDVLNLGLLTDYRKMIEILEENGYVLMEAGVYCTTFADYKTRFKTKVMIDVYNEISVSHLIYLDKRRLSDYAIKRNLPEGNTSKIFAPEVELLATIAHSAIKENKYILAEYYTTLYYLAEMDRASISRFVDLTRDNKLVNAARWHLTITSLLHKMAYGTIPEKLEEVLSMLGGPWGRAYRVVNGDVPPYPCDLLTLMSIFKEKFQDDIFRKSLLDQLLMFTNKAFTRRLLERLNIFL